MLIDVGAETNPIDFRFNWLKVTVKRVTCKKVNIFTNHYHENYLSQSFHILNADWSWWGDDTNWLSVNKVKGQGQKDHFWKIKRFLLIILRTVYQRAFIFLSQICDCVWFSSGLDSYCFFVFLRTRSLLTLESLGRRSRSQGSLL